MKYLNRFRFPVTLILVLALMSPISILAFGDDKKHFAEGMKYEVAEQWDKAVESFALAVAENPKNPEYRLHLTRSLFNASQMYMKKGTAAAKEKDYESGYLAFRRAYAFDPTNELAKSEMERMVRLQKDLLEASDPGVKGSNNKVKLVPTGYASPTATPDAMPQRLEKLRDIPFPSGVDLQFIIKELAKDLDLNVLFDVESFRVKRNTNIELKNVTAARALDYIFLQEGLFFQKVGPRTILVATQQQRQKFQQLVLRTFYLANAAPKDIAKVVQTAIPPQPGRAQTIVLTDDSTNSVTIRDTEENIRLMAKLISSLDKDRAEVVMDVAFYEVNKNDFLQFGLQVGNAAQLTALGGSGAGLVRLGDNPLATLIAGTAAATLPAAIPTGIVLPSASFAAYQSKGNTKLIASTQIHAFNNEDSSARIGQRVPVQSAQFLGVGSGNNNNNQFGQTANVINYEQIGLTLKFKPIVFPNQDVQVAMEIELKDVAGASTLTPTFTERNIKGTARIQNNKTLLLASVAQGTEANSRGGIPFVSWIPLIGRLFSAPIKDNRQVDVVIAVTPRVIRAPAILPEDEVERATGSLGIPTNNNLEAMIIEEERQENLAAARRIGNTAVVQLPDQAPEFVKTDANATATAQPSAAVVAEAVVTKNAEVQPSILKPIDSTVKTLQLNQTSDIVKAPETVEVKATEPEMATEKPSVGSVELAFGSELPEMKAGEKVKIPVLVRGNGKFQSAVIGLNFDSAKVAVRSVAFGDAFGATAANGAATPFLNQNGKMYVSLLTKDGLEIVAGGTLAFIEIEALAAGKPVIAFDRNVLSFLAGDGRNLTVRFD